MHLLKAATHFYTGLNAYKRAALLLAVVLAASGIYVFQSTSDRARARQAAAGVAEMARLLRAANLPEAGSLSAWRIDSVVGAQAPFLKNRLSLRDPWQGPVVISAGAHGGPVTIDLLQISRSACRHLMVEAANVSAVSGVAVSGAAEHLRSLPVASRQIGRDCSQRYTFFRFVAS
jgi:hypothetical protein